MVTIFESLTIRIVTLGLNFQGLDCIYHFRMTLYFVNSITIFYIFSFASQLLPTFNQLTDIWEIVTISNYYNPLPIRDFNLKCQPPSYLPPPPVQLGS